MAAPASAATCTIGQSSATTGYVTCSGVSKWQVAMRCYEPVHDSYSYVYGPIVSSGRSSATCAASHGNVFDVGWRTF